MIAIGIIFIVIGGIVLGYGTNVNNNMDIQLDSFFSSGKTNTGDVFVIVGIILLILGGIFLIAGIIKSIQENKISTNNIQGNSNKTELLNDLRNKNLITQEEYDNRIYKQTSQLNSKVCKHCNSNILENEIYCHNCGKKQSDNKCPQCNFEIVENSHFCSNCGAKIIMKPLIKTCNHCGEELQNNSTFCVKCGTKQ